MAQTPPGSMESNSEASTRVPAFRVRIDWARDGWGNEGSWTDESTRVRSLSISQQIANTRKGGVAILGNAVAGQATLTLSNDDGRLYTHNSGGALYSYIQDGKMLGIPVEIELGFGSDKLPQFSGYICQPSIGIKGGVATIQLQDRAWDYIHRKHSTTLQLNQYADDYLGTLNGLVPAGIRASTDFDRGLYPMMFSWLDDESIWAEMSRVAVAQGGMIWFEKDGTLKFRDGSYFARTTSSEYTFTVARELRETWRPQDVWNHVIVKWGGGRVAAETEIWALPEPLSHPILPGESETIKARFRYPVYAVTTPVADTDYAATAYDGTDGTDDLSVTDGAGGPPTTYAQRADPVLTNNGSKPLYLTKLRLRGWPVDFQDEQQVEVEDSTSIDRYGRRTLEVRLTYDQGKSQAEAIGDFLLARYKIPRATYQLRVPARPWLEVGDRITVNVTKTGVNEDFFIVGLDTAFSVPSGYMHTYTLLRAADLLPYSDWFIVGTTALGTAGRYFY